MGARAVRVPCDRTAVALQARVGKSKAPAASGGGLFPAFGVRVLVYNRREAIEIAGAARAHRVNRLAEAAFGWPFLLGQQVRVRVPCIGCGARARTFLMGVGDE